MKEPFGLIKKQNRIVNTRRVLVIFLIFTVIIVFFLSIGFQNDYQFQNNGEKILINDTESNYGTQQKTKTEPVFLSLEELNNTRLAEKEMLVFNRVPKAGTTSIENLLEKLSTINNFNYFKEPFQQVEHTYLNDLGQQDLISRINDVPVPGVFTKHVFYTNFTRFGEPNPIYINMVRDPVERVISWYYYLRQAWYIVNRHNTFGDELPDIFWLKKSYEFCVLTHDPECYYEQGEIPEGLRTNRKQMLFFCGHDDECLPFNSPIALEKAKYNVEKYYAVVGVLENMNTTLTVFEKYIPRFFKNATEVYYYDVLDLNKDNTKPQVSKEIKDMVRANFSREIEFYEFCKQRLHNQYSALKLYDLI